MHRHFDRASTDPDVHVVVLASALAKVFTAGLDITEGLGGDGFEDYDVGRKALLFRQHITVRSMLDESALTRAGLPRRVSRSTFG